MEEIKRVPCVSCKEPIFAGAAVCPHCRSHQSRPKIHLVANVLKWAAGIITLITLLRSTSDLNKLVTVWLEKEQIAVEYIDAARLLADTGDQKNAQLLLLRAEELKPTSFEIRDIKIGLIKNDIRSYLLLDSGDNQLQQLTAGINKSGEKVFEFQSKTENHEVPS